MITDARSTDAARTAPSLARVAGRGRDFGNRYPSRDMASIFFERPANSIKNFGLCGLHASHSCRSRCSGIVKPRSIRAIQSHASAVGSGEGASAAPATAYAINVRAASKRLQAAALGIASVTGGSPSPTSSPRRWRPGVRLTARRRWECSDDRMACWRRGRGRARRQRQHRDRPVTNKIRHHIRHASNP
mgnify:CR=1 FL=1